MHSIIKKNAILHILKKEKEKGTKERKKSLLNITAFC